MAATTGPALYPGTGTFPNTNVYPGQDNAPYAWVLYSTDDVSVGSPNWVDATSFVRSFNVRRGRDNELAEIDAGEATIVLDNRTRTFDPVSNANVRPLNRWWIREQFSGETQDIFLGYAESYTQGWDPPNDATATVQCADEFKVLQLANLPTTSPPRDSYAAVVAFDNPTGYWPLEVLSPNLSFATTLPGSPGISLVAVGAIGGDLGAGAIIGEEPFGADLNLTHGNYYQTQGLVKGDAGEVTGRSDFTIEGWFKTDSPSVTLNWVVGPTANSLSTYVLSQNGSSFKLEARNSAGTNTAITGGTLVANTYYHVVGTLTGGTLTLYVNGSSVATGAFTGSFHATLDANAALIVGPNVGSGTENVWIDELAFYPYALSSTTVANHYSAGTARGFAYAQQPHVRAGAVLDSIISHAPRNIRAGTRFMTASYMTGQPPLDELRAARIAENVDAMLFTARDGTITFLDAAHRSSSPWNTVQATFGDAGGSELAYLDLNVDYSDSFLVNEWNVTATGAAGGHVQTSSDTTSISRFYKRSQSLTDVPVTQDSQASTIASSLLAKYKDPMTRITQITLTSGIPDVCQAAFRREIGDKIEVLRTPPGGGSRIDQTVFIQGIQVDATPNRAGWRITWNVSPL